MPNIPICLSHAKRTAQLERKHGSEVKESARDFLACSAELSESQPVRLSPTLSRKARTENQLQINNK